MMFKCFNMKRIILCFLISLLLLGTLVVTVNGNNEIYTDTETGITFTIPEGWSVLGVSDERKIVKEKFGTGNDSEVFIFGASNLYDQLDSTLKNQYEKNTLIGFRIDKNQAKGLIDDTSATYYGTETLGKVEWHVFKYLSVYDYYVQTINGKVIFFMFPNFMKDEAQEQVIKVIEQVSITEKEKEDNTLKEINNNANNKELNDLEKENIKLFKQMCIWLAIIAVLLIVKHVKNK